MAQRTVTMLFTLALALALLLPSTGGRASAGTLEKANLALDEYALTLPSDLDAISQLRVAIYCFALARELRKDVPNAASVLSYQKKCGKVPGTLVYIDDPAMAEDEAQLNLMTGFISAFTELIKRTGP